MVQIMESAILRIAKFFWPELDNMSLPRQLVGAGDVITSLYSGGLSLIGIYWVIKRTETEIIVQNWWLFIVLTALIILFEQLNFFIIIEFRSDRYGSADGAFNSMMVWTAMFLFGPTALWIMIALQSAQFLSLWNSFDTLGSRWNNIRNFFLTLSGFTLPYMIGSTVYEAMGGTYPLPVITPQIIGIGLLSILANFLIFILIWTPYFLYSLHTQYKLADNPQTRPIFIFFLLALSLPTVAHPFAILAAGLYSMSGFWVFLYFVFGLIVVAFLARQFSWIAESNRQQSRQLEKLEQLGRSLLHAPPDGSELKNILNEHLPNMFPSGFISVWLIPGQMIYKSDEWEINFRPIWDFTSTLSATTSFLANDSLPWEIKRPHSRPIVIAPIVAHEGTEVTGGVYLELRRLAQPWDQASLEKLYPGIQALADLISSSIHQSEEYAQSLALEKVGQELRIAGQIQASFLPNEFPKIPGWQLAVTLEPATTGGLSGDFFDFIPLSRGRYGIVIADVADKGLGAALYMALCRTLLRTYALEYQSRPDIALSETNDRILSDARANLFITTFYGVLDPTNNTLTYCNAGHNPPYLISNSIEKPPQPLTRTGMPIGIELDSRWTRKTISFSAGDSLIMYTDGVTDAQNTNGDFFDDDRLISAALESANGSAFEQQATILSRVKEFTGDAQQFDDITLMILSKENLQNESLTD